MASMTLQVVVDDLENSELDKLDEMYYKHLANESRRPHSSLPGVVTDVSEIEREEDDEDEVED